MYNAFLRLPVVYCRCVRGIGVGSPVLLFSLHVFAMHESANCRQRK